jgi:hypothetical protein
MEMPDMPEEIERRSNQATMLTMYRVFTGVMSVMLFGVVCWMAFNVSHIPVIELRIEDLNDKFDQRATRLETDMNSTAKWQTDKLNDHEIRIRALETLPKK